MNTNKTFFIAELSGNHNGDYDLAVQTIHAIAESGADAVKIQTYRPESLTLDIDNDYFQPIQAGLWKGWRRFDLYKEAATPYEWHLSLKKEAESLGLVFFSSPFDLDGVDFLETLDIPMYKIASFEINDIPLIKKVAQTRKPVIISTGLAEISDIELAINTCRNEGCEDITLLKCTSQYPATIEQANLLTITDMKRRFDVRVGVSDHTMGHLVPMVAVAQGAEFVEKHFILDRALGGVDSAFSMEPAEFKLMVDQIRQVELSLGKIEYEVTDSDKKKRRSLYAIQDIQQGELFTHKNVKSLRMVQGTEPRFLDQIIGTVSTKYIRRGTPILIE